MDKIAVGPGLPDGVVRPRRQPEREPAQPGPAKKCDDRRPDRLHARPRPPQGHHPRLPRGRRAHHADPATATWRASSPARQPEAGVDMYLGSGGAPEGVLAAAALRCIGGQMQGRLMYEDDTQRERARSMGITDPNRSLRVEDMAQGRRDVRRHRRHHRRHAARRAPHGRRRRSPIPSSCAARPARSATSRAHHNFAVKPNAFVLIRPDAVRRRPRGGPRRHQLRHRAPLGLAAGDARMGLAIAQRLARAGDRGPPARRPRRGRRGGRADFLEPHAAGPAARPVLPARHGPRRRPPGRRRAARRDGWRSSATTTWTAPAPAR